MIDLNNFHTYFPGGINRPDNPKRQEEEYPELRRKISSDLDRLIAETNFDVDSFKREKESWLSKLKQAHELLKTDNVAANRIGEESDQHRENVQKMIFPLYEEMIRLGYQEMDLIR
jgi:hypothetical protein